jgi:RNA polymerase sigma-70 factor (sigma-E family)
MTPEQETSFGHFVAAHGDSLLRYARLLFPDRHAAEDALQTALLRLAQHWHRELKAPAGYVRTSLRNLAVDGGRRRHLVPTPSDGDLVLPHEPDLADAYAAAQALDAVLSALPPRQRVTVVLRVIEGLSEAETAKELSCSTGTVKSNLSRGLANLRTHLAGNHTERTAP